VTLAGIFQNRFTLAARQLRDAVSSVSVVGRAQAPRREPAVLSRPAQDPLPADREAPTVEACFLGP
jgi:hypothetical protein